jgi:hypothetical protein
MKKNKGRIVICGASWYEDYAFYEMRDVYAEEAYGRYMSLGFRILRRVYENK